MNSQYLSSKFSFPCCISIERAICLSQDIYCGEFLRELSFDRVAVRYKQNCDTVLVKILLPDSPLIRCHNVSFFKRKLSLFSPSFVMVLFFISHHKKLGLFDKRKKEKW